MLFKPLVVSSMEIGRLNIYQFVYSDKMRLMKNILNLKAKWKRGRIVIPQKQKTLIIVS